MKAHKIHPGNEWSGEEMMFLLPGMFKTKGHRLRESVIEHRNEKFLQQAGSKS